MNRPQSLEQIIRQRRSCRTYLKDFLRQEDLSLLRREIDHCFTGPFGTAPRFALIASQPGDEESLRDLGTYGFVKNASAFLAGAVRSADQSGTLEDFGYAAERIVLAATAAGLGTCWLGGSFTKSSFASRACILPEETLPAVIAIGYPAERPRARDRLLRLAAGSDSRKPWHELFFDSAFGRPLSRETAGSAGFSLEMLRLAPSASNRQPWRVVRAREGWHFYLHRTKGYASRNRTLFNIADMQRIDMGIAMCHFELAALEIGMDGSWMHHNPHLPVPPGEIEYVATWSGR